MFKMCSMLLVPRFAISNHVKEKRNLKAHKQEVHQTYFAHSEVGSFSFPKNSSKSSSNDAQILPSTPKTDSQMVFLPISLDSSYIHAVMHNL